MSFGALCKGRFFCASRAHTWLESRIWHPEARVSSYRGEPTWETLGAWGIGSPVAPWRAALEMRGRRCCANYCCVAAMVVYLLLCDYNGSLSIAM